MYLKRLELQGFKSFADKTVLEFMTGITTVIGPNGSGKSNISDAIRWVLGEQSMKSLRGAKSEDIIFSGTQNRKSLGFAEASIVIDNTDGKLSIEYTEVTVTRRIYRSGESGYFINKVPCRLKDVLELFMDTGIGKDGYSIIGQGKIDEILSNKSEDRRHIFEEAAGIVKYRARKVESEKKLEHTKLNLLRINDILSEIESNIEPLKQQSEKAKKFLSLREELKSIEIGLFLHHIDSYKEKLVQVKQDYDVMQDTYNQHEKKQEKNILLKENVKKQIDEILEEIEQMQNIGFESSQKQEKLNSEMNVAKQRIANNEENFQRFETEKEEVKEKITLLEEEKKQKLAKKESLFQNKENFEKQLAQKTKQLETLTKKLSAKELEMEQKKKQVEKDIEERYEWQSQINSCDITYENLEKRERAIKNEIASDISELDGSRMNKEEIAKNFYEIEAKRKKAKDSLEEVLKIKEQSNQKTKQYEDEINKITYEIRMKEARLRFLQETEKEKEGYGKSVKNLLLDCEKDKTLGKGMHGVLANILSVDKDYETAIEMCLGAALQNLVTESEEDAKRLVEYLRKNNLGRASFLPISSVKGKKLEKIDTKNILGVIGIASDLVKYQKKYEGVVLHLLGRTMIVDDMESAIALAKKNRYAFRIVTLKGDVINASGAITGGSVTQKTINILGRSREIESLEKDLKKAKTNLEKIEVEKQEYLDSMENVLEQVDSLSNQLQEIEIVYATEHQKVASIDDIIQKQENRIAKLKEELKSLKLQKEQTNQQKKQAEDTIENLTKRIEDLNRQIQEFSNLNKDDQKFIDDLNFDITNLKISVSSFEESETSIDEMAQRIEQDIANNKQSIENKKQAMEEIVQENKDLTTNILAIEKQIEEMRKQVEHGGEKVESLKQKRTQKEEKLSSLEKEITESYKTIEGLKEQLIKMEVKKNKLQQDLEDVVNKMWEEYEVTPNHAQEYEKPNNVAQTQKQVNHLRTKIKDLGSINIDSIEEYKQIKERYDFMCEQRLDLENAITKLRKVISDMTNIMKEQFKEKFKQINYNFNEVFRELFGGGKAELILSDEENILECGIEIQVQPTGKKLQNMTLLSGGEKAFTAIALLFAILKINPAPFCVLDEIEAALDDVNVYRFADYLRKFSSDTQFLVITHRKGTMEVADTVYGITMEENGISKLLSMKLK